MKTLDFRNPHLLRDDLEYESALAEIEQLLARDPEPFSAAFERLEFLALLVERYEEENFPIDAPSPQSLVDFMLEQKGMTRADLDELEGWSKSRVSEFFNQKRGLSLTQIKSLHTALGVPTDILILSG